MSAAETGRLEGHTDWVTALAVLAGGRLASVASDNTVRLWDPATGAETARLEVDGVVHCFTVMPAREDKGSRLIAGGERPSALAGDRGLMAADVAAFAGDGLGPAPLGFQTNLRGDAMAGHFKSRCPHRMPSIGTLRQHA